MNQEEIFAVLNANPAFYLATVEDGAPRVRGMLLYRADRQGIVFHTGTMKDLHRQLLAEPQVEMCFFDPARMVQVRVRGTAGAIGDQAFKEEIVRSPGREFLRPWIEQLGYDILSVFRITGCTASVWTLPTNFAPKEFIDLR